MGREFEGPLSKSDLEYLRSRYPNPYVEHMIELHGTKKGSKKSSEGAGDGDSGDSKGSKGDDGTEAQNKGDGAGEGAGEGSTGGEGDEDLIGSPTFDILKATETEVGDYLKTLEGEALEGAKAQLLAVESAREDREPRKGVVGLLQPAE